jgi:hypothetical protein
MSKGVTIVVGVFVGGGLGVLGGIILPCEIYPDSNLCGIFGAITMPAGAVVGGVTGAVLSARRASFAVMCGALLGGTVGVVGIIIPAMMYPKSDVSKLLFLLFPVTTMLGGGALGAVLGGLLAPRRKPGVDENPSGTGGDELSHS